MADHPILLSIALFGSKAPLTCRSFYGKIGPLHEACPLEGIYMDTLKKNLEQSEKSKVIALITPMLHQEPDLQWLPTTWLPIASSRKVGKREEAS